MAIRTAAPSGSPRPSRASISTIKRRSSSETPGVNLAGKTLRARVRLLAGPLFGGGVQLVAFSGPTFVEADGPLLDAAALPEGGWVSLEFALDQADTATFDPSSVGGFAVRLRSGSAAAGDVFTAAGGATVIELDDVAD